jgi:MarR family transcriptional regulator, organic hydroperoxide resistance regulator
MAGVILFAEAGRRLHEFVAYDAGGQELERVDLGYLDPRDLCKLEPTCPSPEALRDPRPADESDVLEFMVVVARRMDVEQHRDRVEALAGQAGTGDAAQLSVTRWPSVAKALATPAALAHPDGQAAHGVDRLGLRDGPGVVPVPARWQCRGRDGDEQSEARMTPRLSGTCHSSRTVSNLGLSAAEINALACFGGEESRTVRQLVVATAQRPSTLTGVLDRLEGRGLIERTPNPADRRSVLVRITQSGRAVAARVAGGFAALERRLPAGDVRRLVTVVDEAVDDRPAVVTRAN